MEEKLDHIYVKHLVVCTKVNEIWAGPWDMNNETWHKRRDLREKTAHVISEYLEKEMRKYRQLWTDAQQKPEKPATVIVMSSAHQEIWRRFFKRFYKNKL